MAIQSAISVLLDILGDGVAIFNNRPKQWVSTKLVHKDRKFPAPIGIQALTAVSASLVGTVITLTFSAPPSASSPTNVNLRLLFAGE